MRVPSYWDPSKIKFRCNGSIARVADVSETA